MENGTREINVISLFNGMSTLQQALTNKGFKIKNYYSSEIKPYAIKLNQHHFPETIQVGDINNWREWDIDWKTIDFIGSGSPCQDLSAAGKREGINGSRSNLFFVFVEILEHVKKLNPNVKFLQENVGSANKLDIGIMSRALGVYPARINSSLVTAQLRDRYYWSNIKTKKTIFDTETDIPAPKDLNIKFKDIITTICGNTDRQKSTALLEGYVTKNTYTNEKSKKAQDYLKSRDAKGICPLVYEEKNVRTINQTEMERLQGFPDGYTSILSKSHAGSLLGDGWTLPIIEHILSFYKI